MAALIAPNRPYTVLRNEKMPEQALRHQRNGELPAISGFATRAAAEERSDRGGKVVYAGRDRVAAVIAFGVSLLGLVAAVRTFDGVVVVVVLAHLWFLCGGALVDVTTAKIESQTGWEDSPEVFGAA